METPLIVQTVSEEIRPPIILARLTRTRHFRVPRIEVFHILVPNYRVRLEIGLFYDYARLLVMPLNGFGTFLETGDEDVAAAEFAGMIQDCEETHL